MHPKMVRFLSSLGIQDAERFDFSFRSIAMSSTVKGQVDMVIQKDLPWDYPLLSEFMEALPNAKYPYTLRFVYLNPPTHDDVATLFFNWYFSLYLDTPSVGLEPAGDMVLEVTYKDEEQSSALAPRIKEFREFLSFIGYDFALIEKIQANESKEPEPIEEQEEEAEEEEEPFEESPVVQPQENLPYVLDEEDRKEYEAGEELLLKDMEKNLQKAQQERERQRVWTIGDYEVLPNLGALAGKKKGNIDFSGEVFQVEARMSRQGKTTVVMGIGDSYGAVSVRAFEGKRLDLDKIKSLKPKQMVRIRGALDIDKFNNQQTVIAHFVELLPPKALRDDPEPEKRVELHLHTKFSTMDGLADFGQYYQLAEHMGMEAIAITDHGVAQGFPSAQTARREHLASLKKRGLDQKPLKVIYGVELYMFDLEQQYILNPCNTPLKSARYCVFDTETTGLSARYDRVIEFGGVIVEAGRVLKRFDTFINPEIPLTGNEEALEKNHIRPEDLKDAPTMKQVLPKILEFFGDNILVAHNANFDVGFINAALEREGLPPLSNPIIDTVPISHYLFPLSGYHSEGAFLKNLGLNIYKESEAHRADYDSEKLNEGWQEAILMLNKRFPNITHADLQNLRLERGDPKHQGRKGDEKDPEYVEFKAKENAFNSFCRHIHDYHCVILAKNQQGLQDINRIVTEGHTTYMARYPKTPRSLIDQYRENLLVGSACFNGEIFELARTRGFEDLVKAMQWYDYIEVQPLENYSYLLNMGDVHSKEQLVQILRDIVAAAKAANKLVVATGDVHYLDPEDKILRDIYIYAKAIGNGSHPLNPPRRDKLPRFENPDQHFRSTREMLDSFMTWMDEEEAREVVITNSRAVASLIDDDITPVSDDTFTPDKNLPNSDVLLRNLCEGNFHANYDYNFDDDPEVLAAVEKTYERLQRELHGIISNGYAVNYYIAHKLIQMANDEPEHYIVGSRGSVGSSFAATMADITEVNPLPAHYHCPHCHYLRYEDPDVYKSGFDLPDTVCPKCGTKMRGDGQNIPFETFLGFNADKVPDIDLNFEEESQHTAHDYCRQLLGERNVFRAGTVEKVATKTAFGFVRGYFEKIGRNPDEINTNFIAFLAARCEGVKRTTGQHPGGIVVVPNDHSVYEFTATQHPADDLESDWLTTHYDYKSMHDELLKFDILGHVDPMAMRYYRDLTGVKIEDIPMNDPRVLSIFTSPRELKMERNYLGVTTGASALPEFGTKQGLDMLETAQPKTFNDLLIISGLAHGTNVWAGNAEDLVKSGKTLNEVIGCRDDIMTYLISMGIEPSEAFKIMEAVRKGKGLLASQEADLRAHRVPDYYIDSCNKIAYLFPRGHATAYVTMAVRVAYFKLYYPLEFYAVFFSVRSDDWDIKSMIQGEEAVIARIKEWAPRLNDRKNPLSTKERRQYDTLLIALEMLERGYHFENIDLYRSDSKMFVVDHKNKALIPPFRVIAGLGESAAGGICAAREELDMNGNKKPFLSKEDLLRRAKGLSQTNLNDLNELGVLDGLGETNQISLFEFM